MFNKGDVIVGLRESSHRYSLTVHNTQWIVYDRKFEQLDGKDYILVGNPCPKDIYIERQQKYDSLKSQNRKSRSSIRTRAGFHTHWVEPHYFKLVCALVMDHNEDALRFLNEEDEQPINPLEGLRL